MRNSRTTLLRVSWLPPYTCVWACLVVLLCARVSMSSLGACVEEWCVCAPLYLSMLAVFASRHCACTMCGRLCECFISRCVCCRVCEEEFPYLSLPPLHTSILFVCRLLWSFVCSAMYCMCACLVLTPIFRSSLFIAVKHKWPLAPRVRN